MQPGDWLLNHSGDFMCVRPKEESTVKPMQCVNADFYLHKH